MFKKLKEKIAEEVKPLKITQFTQAVVTPGNNAVVESPPNEPFSLDDELHEDLFGNEGFSVVDLHHPSLPAPLSSGRISHQSSMSSLASDASAYLPILDTSIGTFNSQDFESASEREDVLPQINSLSKQELCNSYLKLYRHYQKYKGRATDLKKFCRELEKDNKKHKTVLLECQEKSLRRIAELKEQCALEQHAKAHLEEALRNDLEEKDHVIQTLQTKINLLKDAHLANSSGLARVDENLLLIPGEIGEGCEGDLSLKSDDLPTQQEPLTENPPKKKLDYSYEENEIMILKNRFENLKARMLKNSAVYNQDCVVNAEFQDILNEISECLRKKRSSSPCLNEKQINSTEAVDENIYINENDERHSNLLLLDRLELDPSVSEGHNPISTLLALENVPVRTKKCIQIVDQANCAEIEGSTYANSMNNLPELKIEFTDLQNKFEKVTQELEESHQLISEQNSTIARLNEKLATLECEFAVYNDKQSIGSIKSELIQGKQEIQKVQQQIFEAQQTIKEKDNIIEETKDALKRNQQELEEVLTQKTEIARTLITVQSELAQAKRSSEELNYKILNSNEETLKKESVIFHLNKEIEKVKKELQLAESENHKRNEMVRHLEIALSETNRKCEQISTELELQAKLIEEKDLIAERIKKDFSCLQKDLDIVSSVKDERDKMISALQMELKDINLRFEKATKELASFQTLLKEKDDLIDKTKEELNIVHQELVAASHEKVSATTFLQNQLTDVNLQLENLRKDLLSAHQIINSKDSDIVNVRACLESVQDDMETVSSRANQTIGVLQNELRESKSQCEELTVKLHNANKSIDEKNNEIFNLKQDFESVKKEMERASSQNVEKNQVVKKLENDLTEAKVQLSKLCKEIDDFNKLTHEKDLTIKSANDELADVRKNLQIILAQKTEAYEVKANLEDKLAVVNRSVELLMNDIQSARNHIDEKDSNYNEVCGKLSDIRKELDTTILEKAKAEDNVAKLEEELSNMSVNVRELTDELECSSKLLEERNFKISCLTEETASIRDALNKMGAEKEGFNEKILSLKKELTATKLQLEQVSQEMQSAYHTTREKDMAIAHITEKLENSKKDLDIMSLQKIEACRLVNSLRDKLEKTSANFEHVSKQLQEVRESVKEKNLIIADLTADLTARNELASTFSLKVESYEPVTRLQNELKDSNLCCDKEEEHISAHQLLEEKDLHIKQLKIDLLKIQEELNKASILNSETNKHVESLQSESKEAKIDSELIFSETTKQLYGKDLESHLTRKRNDGEGDNSSVSTEETPKLVRVLQNKLENSEQELRNIIMELQISQKRVEEKEIIIKNLQEELADVHKKINDNENKTDRITGEKLQNPLLSENLEHIFENNFSNNQIDSYTRTTISNTGQPSVDSSELCSRNMWRKSSHESDSKMKPNECVVVTNEQQQSKIHRLKCSVYDSSLSSVDTTNLSSQDTSVSSDKSVNLSTCALQITSNVTSSLVSENDFVSDSVLSSEEPSRLSGEGNNNLKSNTKPLQSDIELSSWTDAHIPVETNSTGRNARQALQAKDRKNKSQVEELEFSSIQRILDEIQKENEEYGSLLDRHKNIINHLEGISKMQPEEKKPGSAEWLHKQLITLSQKLYDTKEKQNVQIDSINRLVKHQQDLMKSHDNEISTIEMQYLRNIIFQYMIGKETMLLAKVISAVMKFDSQQLDQVMQKELQKQTLLGQLGLL